MNHGGDHPIERRVVQGMEGIASVIGRIGVRDTGAPQHEFCHVGGHYCTFPSSVPPISELEGLGRLGPTESINSGVELFADWVQRKDGPLAIIKGGGVVFFCAGSAPVRVASAEVGSAVQSQGRTPALARL